MFDTVTTASQTDFTGGSAATSAVERDFNGDGKIDIAVATAGAVFIYQNQGDGTFSTMKSFSTGAANFDSMVAGDFKGDGRIDLAGASGSVATILTGNGDGTFNPATGFALGASTAVALVSADFDANGITDLAAAIDNASSKGATLGIVYGDPRLAFGTVITDPHSLGGEVYALYDGLL